MAGQGDDWNSFIQSKPVQVFLYGFCSVCCAFYSVGAVVDLVRPDDSTQLLIETMGQQGFVIMTVVRLLVCLWAAVAFARMTVKALQSKDE